MMAARVASIAVAPRRGRQMGRPTEAPLKRFERSYIPEPNSGCWLWTGALDAKTGYAHFRFDAKPGHSPGAHRASYRLFKCAEIPDGLMVCHKCDVRSCVNPDHLFLGTATDNMSDAAAKGRMKWKRPTRPELPRGEAHHMARLTADDVIAIRASRRPGIELAERYGVSGNTVSRVRRRVIWRHVA